MQIILSLILANFLNKKLKGITLFRTAFYTPVITSWVAAGVVLRWILASDIGLLNTLLWSFFHIKGPSWLLEPKWAMVSIILANLWKGVGFNTMLYLTGLQDIPEEIMDTAMVDGTNSFQRFFFYYSSPFTSDYIFCLYYGYHKFIPSL